MDEHTKSHYSGSLKELFFLFCPILLMTFSNSLFLLVEKLLLARFSTQAMEAAISAAYACQVFQGPCVALAMMAQVFVGRWQGAKEFKAVGPGIWQFIWFSLLSLAITFPLGFIYGMIYFENTAIQDIVMPYYYFLLATSFLYPLSTALSCFYLGQGKTRLILLLTIGAQAIKLLLAYLFIFGWENFIPAYGLMGGAVSTATAQLGYCLVLISVFLNSQHAKIFDTRSWSFRPQLFWECIQYGLLRGLNRVLNFTSWASIAYLMTIKGGDYLLVLSIGGTLFLFLPFLGDAICQGQITIVSNLLGAKKYHLLNKSFWSGTIFALVAVTLMSIPFLIFPVETFEYLFPKISMEEETIRMVFFGIWVSAVFLTIDYVPISFILAFKDTKFSFWMGCFNWVNGFLLMYYFINIFNISAARFWLALSLMHASTFLLYLWRMNVLQSRVEASVELAQSPEVPGLTAKVPG